MQGRDVKPAEGASRSGSSTSEVPRTVVLAVPFNEVNRLALAAETGKILLALRNPLDQIPPLAQPATTAAQVEMAGKVTLRQAAGSMGSIALADKAAESKSRAGSVRPEKGVEVIRGLRRGS